jgi:Domain of unknown function (DUF4194)
LRYDNLSLKDKDEFKRVCNKLLSCCLLCKKKEDTKKDYYFVEAHKEDINEYFAPLGYEVEVNSNLGAAQLINKFNHNKFNLKLIESITLLILRILYNEKMEELSLNEHVMVEISELQEKFIALEFKDKLIDKTSLNQALRTLKKFNIIDTLDRDMTLGESRIIVYPSILMIVRMDDIKKIYDKLLTYKRSGVNTDEEADSDQAD